jgi:anthranilate synthase component 1
MPHELPDFDTFRRLATAHPAASATATLLIPMARRLMSDTLTPVLAYRRLVRPDDRMAPSFLLESVVAGDRVGRYSYLGARPVAQILARSHQVQYLDSIHPDRSRQFHSPDPLAEVGKVGATFTAAPADYLPEFAGGWVGYAGYDTVRYLEGEKLPSPPRDDRHLPDLQMGLYRQIVAFDHVQKTVLAIVHVAPWQFDSLQAAYEAGRAELDDLVQRITTPFLPAGESNSTPKPPRAELPVGSVDLDSPPPRLPTSNMGQGGYQRAVEKIKQYIAAGDVFQVVPSQRFELRTHADPFDIYRALRVINPSPYMFYLQVEGGMLVGSSPEILCRVHSGVVTNRPLAGTRPRGRDPEEDLALEKELLADPKERAEHIMLVDLARNDVGRVAQPGSVALPEVMVVERYSHVMHISSTVTGRLDPGRTCWDALRHTLPVGTVSGAPKVRAMQIIDEIEPTRRGPYAGAVGYADFAGNMDMAIALRTMVVLPAQTPGPGATHDAQPWIVHIQAGSGIVADSQPEAEHQETVNKAAALAKAVDLAEKAFAPNG